MSTNYTRWYRVGLVSTTQNSKTIIGTDTYWANASLKPGDLISVANSSWYEIDTVTDNTHITLKTPYLGLTLSGQNYAIIRNFTASMQADIAANTADLLHDFRNYIDEDMQSIHGKNAFEMARDQGLTQAKELKAGGELAELKTLVSPLLANNVQAHNSFARGTSWGNLGNSLTAEQSSAIAAGTFKDIYPGDSWHFSQVAYSYEDENGVTQSATFSGYFMVAECDYYYYMGQNSRFNQHHVLVIPTDVLFLSAQMNASNTREGGYVASLMHTVHRKRAEAIFKACFGEQHVLTFEDKFSSGETNANGNVTSAVWASCQAQLLNERMIFGNTIESADHYANSSSRQLAIMRYRPYSFVGSNPYWLRDIGIRGGFVYVDATGNLHAESPNKSYGVRAYALIQ